MRGKTLLIIAIVLGLIAGPAWSYGVCAMGAPAAACQCCEPTDLESCCVTDAVPVRETPAAPVPAGSDFAKLALEPLLSPVPHFSLGMDQGVLRPPVVAGAGSASVRLEKICVRLI